MRIGLLSDSHDHIQNLRSALEIFRKEGITHLVHCGDLSSVETAREMGGFEVIYLQGNIDSDSLGIRRTLLEMNPANFAGALYTGEFDGVRFAALHGNVPGMIVDLAASGKYTYLFHGHTHRRRDQMVHGTRVINPGALGGLSVQSRSVAIVDFKHGVADFIDVPVLP